MSCSDHEQLKMGGFDEWRRAVLKVSVMAEIERCTSSWHKIQRRKTSAERIVELKSTMILIRVSPPSTRTSSTKVGWWRRYTPVCALLRVSSRSERLKSVSLTRLLRKLSRVTVKLVTRTTREATRSIRKSWNHQRPASGGSERMEGSR